MRSTLEENTPAPADFIFVGEHPAVDFANTRVLAHDAPFDYLSSWADVVRWLSATKLAQEESGRVLTGERDGSLERVIELRDVWKTKLARLSKGKAVTQEFVHRINTLLATESFHEVLHAHGKNGFRVTRSISKLSGEKLALFLIARQIMLFLAEANFEHVRRCANHDSCVLYFYDTTKNHRRQWCSTATCGNRHKVAAFRARRAKQNKLRRNTK